MNDVESCGMSFTQDIGRACYRLRGHGGNEETPDEGGLFPTRLLGSLIPINPPNTALREKSLRLRL